MTEPPPAAGQETRSDVADERGGGWAYFGREAITEEMKMDNQHQHIKGYRDLSQAEIDAMNAIKAKGEEIGALVAQLRATEGLDQRWVSIGATELQQGIMALVRAVAQPTTF